MQKFDDNWRRNLRLYATKANFLFLFGFSIVFLLNFEHFFLFFENVRVFLGKFSSFRRRIFSVDQRFGLFWLSLLFGSTRDLHHRIDFKNLQTWRILRLQTRKFGAKSNDQRGLLRANRRAWYTAWLSPDPGDKVCKILKGKKLSNHRHLKSFLN